MYRKKENSLGIVLMFLEAFVSRVSGRTVCMCWNIKKKRDSNQVAGDCAMLPLALNVVGSLARERPLEAATWQDLHDELLTKRVELFEAEPEPEAHLFAAVDAGIDHLPDPQKERFSLLAVMSPGAIATTDMLANLWDMVRESYKETSK